ncbi:hypothetical protein GA0115233_1008115 [Streptomyces sp. DI166]|uniref:hypothetical protein n=1 Tax=Streptomyces sp. DI166 TaxID=1839783 RepID=UPI0007F3346F|nr:hypothetical protein [Streptomyces sp. DI166]SBT89342.1 hypothetical protein GA0115233_1008115 [Streptomyces sp. DI166]
MTSHDHGPLLPEVIVYDGEFVDDDAEPQPGAGPAPAAARRQTARRIAHAAATAARFITGRTLPGLRNAWALTVHWAALRYMTGDEIRRRIVKKQLDHYTERRDDARTARDTTLKQMSKLVDKAADDGLSGPEKNRLRDLGAEADRRRNGLAVLNALPFTPTQPTAEQITRWRGSRGAVRFTCLVVPALGALATVTAAAPLSALITGPALLGGGWWLTRHPIPLTTRPIPAELLIPELDAPADYQLDEPRTAPQPEANQAEPAEPSAVQGEEEQEPGSLAEARTGEQAAAVLAIAIRAEGRDLAEVAKAVEEPWGWSFYVRFSTGSPDELNKDDVYKGLITRLRLRRNGLLVEGDPEAGDSAFVRALLRDPFSPEVVGPLPYRPPLSMSILDAADFGVAMDGTPLVFSLAGLMMLMVADSGGGKSGVMLALAEAATACRDAVVFNIDPAGTGVGALGEAITLSACMDDELIQAVLDFLLQWCAARARQRARYGWGNKWRVSEEHPAVVVYVDEWPQLSDEAKVKLVRAMLLGRKEALWFEADSQFGTREHLGQAIGPKLSTRLLGACRRVDVTELLGGGAIAEGYRADLLQAATHTQVNDAGQIYAQGLPGLPNRPIRYKVREVSDAQAARLGAERAAAGLPDLTHTLTEAGLWQTYQDLLARCRADTTPPPAPAILLTVREAFRAEHDPDALTVAQLAEHLRADDADRWGRWDNRADRLAMIGRHLRKALTDAGVELASTRLRHLSGEPTGYLLSDVRTALTAFS